MMDMVEALKQEIERNEELLKLYQEIPTGAFGAMMINADLTVARDALASGDAVRIIKAYKALEDNE